MFISLVCVNFPNETRWYRNQEMYIVKELLLERGKGMVMSGINYVRTGVKFVALFVDSRPFTTEVRLSVYPLIFFLNRQIYSV